MPSFPRIVVIGASAGGPDALRQLFRHLPANFPAPVLVVMHIGSYASNLPRILQRDSRLEVRHAVHGEALAPGAILLAPPDHHLLVEDGRLKLSRGAKENFSRPAIDPLFRSAALFHREKVIGMILTGLLDDGTIGLQAIKAYGGIAMVQDPDEAEHAAMPRSAARHVKLDACLPLDALAERLLQLVQSDATPLAPKGTAPLWQSIAAQVQLDLQKTSTLMDLQTIAKPSTFTYPECPGTLWELNEADPPLFRCHTGHVFTSQGLVPGQDVVEEALWAAVRALHEKQALLKRLAEFTGSPTGAKEHTASAQQAGRQAEVLRKLITDSS